MRLLHRLLLLMVLLASGCKNDDSSRFLVIKDKELGMAVAYPPHWFQNTELLSNAKISIRNWDQKGMPEKDKVLIHINFSSIGGDMSPDTLAALLNDRTKLAGHAQRGLERKLGRAINIFAEDTKLGGQNATLLGYDTSVNNLGVENRIGVVVILVKHPYRPGAMNVTIEGLNWTAMEPEKHLRALISGATEVLVTFQFLA